MKYPEYEDIFRDNELPFGRMISSSKSQYRQTHPNHKIVFNARVYLENDYTNHRKLIADFFEGMTLEVWYGDLDLTVDSDKLKGVSKDLGTLIITTENGEFVDKIK